MVYSGNGRCERVPIKAIQNSWAASRKLKKFFRGSRKQMSPDSRAGNLQKDLEVHVCHVSMVNRKLEAGPGLATG